MEHIFLMFLDHTQRRSTVGRTPLDEWSARRTDLYLTTHDTHNRQISMPPVGFEPTISAGERPVAGKGQLHATDVLAPGRKALETLNIGQSAERTTESVRQLWRKISIHAGNRTPNTRSSFPQHLYIPTELRRLQLYIGWLVISSSSF